MDDDISLREILNPKENFLGQNFRCIESNQTWEYDVTISKSFPGLHLNGHYWTKGLTISNIKCLNIIKNQFSNYIGIVFRRW